MTRADRLRAALRLAEEDRDFAIAYGARVEAAGRLVVRAWDCGADPSDEIEILARALRIRQIAEREKGEQMTDTETHEPEPVAEPEHEPTHEGPSSPEPVEQGEPET